MTLPDPQRDSVPRQSVPPYSSPDPQYPCPEHQSKQNPAAVSFVPPSAESPAEQVRQRTQGASRPHDRPGDDGTMAADEEAVDTDRMPRMLLRRPLPATPLFAGSGLSGSGGLTSVFSALSRVVVTEAGGAAVTPGAYPDRFEARPVSGAIGTRTTGGAPGVARRSFAKEVAAAVAEDSAG